MDSRWDQLATRWVLRRSETEDTINASYVWQLCGLEMLCLQVVAQLGDRTTARRSAKLASSIDCPHACVVADYAGVLASGDGGGLQAVAERFEVMRDRLALADVSVNAASHMPAICTVRQRPPLHALRIWPMCAVAVAPVHRLCAR